MRGDVDDVLALPPSRLAEEPLLTAVVVVDVEEEVARRVVEGPTRKGAGRLPHIVFGVVADAHREALHELTGKVLVGVGLVVGAGVEPDQHRRVLRDCLGERVERARAQRSEELVLAVHEVGISDLLVRGRELLVQKQDELFPKRRVADDHPIDPPGGKRDELGVVVVAEPWDVRLRKRREVRDPEGRSGGVHLGEPCHQLVDGGFEAELLGRFDFCRRCPESGSPEQVRERAGSGARSHWGTIAL